MIPMLRAIRGAAMIETAVSLSLMLLTIYGAMDLGLMGYVQLQLDGATFFYTHAQASGASDTAHSGSFGSQLTSLFPLVATAQMTPIPQAPPDTDMPVNYTQWGTTTERFGGSSLLRPQRMMTQATYTIAGGTWNAIFPVKAQPITLSAGNVDARPIIGNHDDDAQGDDYNSSSVYNSLVDPLVGDDQNVPPYYFNFAFMWQCPGPPFGQPGTNWIASGQSATCSSMHLNSLGLAEFLKDDNYYSSTRPNNGIDSGGTFEIIKWHQQVYSVLSLELASLTARPDQATWNSSLSSNSSIGMPGAIMSYYFPHWDVANIQSIGAPSGSMLGRQNPLHPEWGCTWC